MTMMDLHLLERRREINRRAARKSRSRQKETAIQIRKKFFEVQSANTKLIYERNQLEKERNQLRAELEHHSSRCSLSVHLPFASTQDDPSLEEDLFRRHSFSRSQSVLQDVASSNLCRSISWPTSRRYSTGNQNAFDGTEEMSASSEDEGPYSITSSEASMSSSFTELDIRESILASNSDPIYLGLSELSHNTEDSPFLMPCEELSDFLNDKSNQFSIFDELYTSSTPALSETTTDLPAVVESSATASSLPSSLANVDFIPHNVESENVSPLTRNETFESYFEAGQQSEAIDLSKRGPLSQVQRFRSVGSKSLPSTPSVPENREIHQTTTFSRENSKTLADAGELSVSEQSNTQNVFGNIPLHVESFIVGDKY